MLERYFVCTGLLLATMNAVSAQQPTAATSDGPVSAQAKQIERLVDKAAAVVGERGKQAFAEFRKDGTEWKKGGTYLFAYDLKANVLLNVAFPEREGMNVSGEKDSRGKAYHEECIRVVQSKGSGWVDYMYPKPGEKEPSHKWSYVKAVNVDGTPGLIGAGFYSE
jgi:cytochrome c